MKAWTLRGTLHLHPADELELWLAAQRAAAGTSPDDPPDLAEWRDRRVWFTRLSPPPT